MRAVPSKVIFCHTSRCGVQDDCSIYFSLVFLIIPEFPITTSMTIVFVFHIQGLCTWTTFQPPSEPYFIQMELRYLFCNRSSIDDLSQLHLVYQLVVLCRLRLAYPQRTVTSLV